LLVVVEHTELVVEHIVLVVVDMRHIVLFVDIEPEWFAQLVVYIEYIVLFGVAHKVMLLVFARIVGIVVVELHIVDILLRMLVVGNYNHLLVRHIVVRILLVLDVVVRLVVFHHLQV
jgi:hypothetical protein